MTCVTLTSCDPLVSAFNACFIPETVTEIGGLSTDGSPWLREASCSDSAFRAARDLTGLMLIMLDTLWWPSPDIMAS